MTASSASAPSRPAAPRTIQAAAGALVITAVGGIVGAVSLRSSKDWLIEELRQYDVEQKVNPPRDTAALAADADAAIGSFMVTASGMGLILVLLAWMALKGRPFTKWAVIGLLFLTTLAPNLPGGLSWLFVGGSDLPGGFKIGNIVAAAAFISAAILLMLRPSTEYFQAQKLALLRSRGLAAADGKLPERPPMFGPRARARAAEPPASAKPASQAKGSARTSKRPPVQQAKVTLSKSEGSEPAAVTRRPAAKSRAGTRKKR